MALAQKLTYHFKNDEVKRQWFLVDASGKTLGRVASRVAHILRGKHKPTFTPNSDCGDFVVVVNADKVKVTGKRDELKTYFHYTGYPGGATVESYRQLMKTKPERVFTDAVRGMIPHNRLGVHIMQKLKVYRGSAHPHAAQKPETLSI